MQLQQPAPSGTSTVPPDVDLTQLRRATWVRRALLALLCGFLLLGLLGVFGPRSERVSAASGGVELTVEHPSVTRAGLDSPWSVEVRREGGFDGPVRLRTTSSYFDRFDENGLDPEPASATQDARWITWEFDQPSGDVLVVSLDARLAPTVQSGMSATTELLDGDRPVVGVTYRTRVMP